MKKTVCCGLIAIGLILAQIAGATDPGTEGSDTQAALHAAVKKAAAELIVQAVTNYAEFSEKSIVPFENAYQKVVPNWRCPTVIDRDIQRPVADLYLCSMIAARDLGLKEISDFDDHSTRINALRFFLFRTRIQAAQKNLQTLNAQLTYNLENTLPLPATIVLALKDQIPEAPWAQIEFPLTMAFSRLKAKLLTSATATIGFQSFYYSDPNPKFSEDSIWNADRDAEAFADNTLKGL